MLTLKLARELLINRLVNSLLRWLASSHFNHPTKNLKFVGVTGTNGKTSVATLHYQLFRKLGYKCGLVSTISYLAEGEEVLDSRATPATWLKVLPKMMTIPFLFLWACLLFLLFLLAIVLQPLVPLKKTVLSRLAHTIESMQRLRYLASVSDQTVSATCTTPGIWTLNFLFSQMVKKGCTHCFMEVSSHAAGQRRFKGLRFEVGIFTNLSQDHLDYYRTMERYSRAKKRFFDTLPAQAFALVNRDDERSGLMLQDTPAQKRTYSLNGEADFRTDIVEMLPHGMKLRIRGKEIQTLLVGKFNAYNLTAVCGSAVLLGEKEDEVFQGMSQLEPISGRFETIRSADGRTAIVDYAHTPDALENVLNTMQEIALRTSSSRIISVVGAGGDRDKTKRPKMAAVAASMSDCLILTSDNPRTEDPERILDDMESGLTTPEAKERSLRITDRRKAIERACEWAQPKDMILIAGKGHETYQEVNGVRYHFDDREAVHEIFSSRK